MIVGSLGSVTGWMKGGRWKVEMRNAKCEMRRAVTLSSVVDWDEPMDHGWMDDGDTSSGCNKAL